MLSKIKNFTSEDTVGLVKEVMGWGVFILVTGFLGLLVWTQLAGAETVYEPLTPQAQRSYDSARMTLCEAEKALAQAKLADIASGVTMEADLNELYRKREAPCGF